jgi:hypothetical protein
MDVKIGYLFVGLLLTAPCVYTTQWLNTRIQSPELNTGLCDFSTQFPFKHFISHHQEHPIVM